MKWWERYPNRLHQEVERLRARGFTTEFDPTTVEGDVAQIGASYVLEGQQHQLIIVFPDLYPYFRPQVFAAGLALAHHQNPFDNSLCLLGRNTDYWDSTLYIADVIAEQLPKLLASERIAGGGKPEEELHAEPWTEYLGPHPKLRVAWNQEIDVPTGTTGKIELTYTHQAPVLRAYVNRVVTGEGAVFAETESPVPDARTLMRVPFLRLDTVPPRNPADLVDTIREKLPRFNPRQEIRKLAEHTRGTLVALFYPEETAYRKDGIGLVLVLFTPAGNGERLAYVKTYRVGASSLAARLGTYGSIRENRILLVGFGSLGSAVTVGLCKLGVREITIVDRDVLEPGNTVRHALGMQYFGVDKAGAAIDALRSAYPYTKISTLSYRLGDFGREANPQTAEFLAALDTSDVIVDCSAERAVQQYLSDESWRLRKHYFFLETYPGVLGGFIGSVAPGVGPCFYCFLNGLVTGAISQPPIPGNALIQPAGCGEPTFVGTPFDADTMAAAGVRLIFGKLAKGRGYPSPGGSYLRAAFASDDLTRSRVVIEPIEIPEKADCHVCGKS